MALEMFPVDNAIVLLLSQGLLIESLFAIVESCAQYETAHAAEARVHSNA